MNAKIIVGVCVLALMATGFIALPLIFGPDASGSFSAYQMEDDNGNGWDGTGEARRALANDQFTVRNVASSPLILKDVDPRGTFLIIVGMDLPYTPSETKALDDFMKDGGTILLLDDGAYGAEFAGKYDVGFRTRPLFDQAFERNQTFVRVSSLVNQRPFQVLLNGPSALKDIDKNDTRFQKLMNTSDESFMDLNENGIIDVVDKVGPFNVGLSRSVGLEGGHLIVVSDSGWITNNMMKLRDKAQNEEYLKALVSRYLDPESLRKTEGDQKLVLFDESRRTAAKLEVGIYATERTLLIVLRSLPFTGVLLSLGLVMLAVVNLVRLPGPESWFHRFLPHTYVPPPVAESEREVLTDLLQIKKKIDEGGGAPGDPTIAQAVQNPQGVPDEDVPGLLRRIATTMDLDLPAAADEKSPPATPETPPRAPGRAPTASANPA